MSDEDKLGNQASEAAKLLPAEHQASAGLAIALDHIAGRPEEALTDVMRFVAHAVTTAAKAGLPVGLLVRALVVSLATGVAMAHEDEDVTPSVLMSEVVEALATAEDDGTYQDVRDAYQAIVAAKDIQSDLDQLLEDDDAFDGLLGQ